MKRIASVLSALAVLAALAVASPAQSFAAQQSGSVNTVVPDETIAPPAQALRTIYEFNGTGGFNSYSALVQATDGNLYGTTYSGGTYGWGTVFRITPSGALTTLYSFCAQPNCVDDANSYASLIQATDGNFYGTTFDGGPRDQGTVFKITPNGVLTTLYNFCSQSGCVDGTMPYAGLVQGTNGNFYGVTVGGSWGTIFELTPSGTITILHSFDQIDGQAPEGGLVQATDGNFYGTTTIAGDYKGGGTVFRITPDGTLTTLYIFCLESGCLDGDYPMAGLVQAANGDLYGTTTYGGVNSNYGTVLKITLGGVLTTLHSFNNTDGANPAAALVRGTDGNLYGTTQAGGTLGYGTVFRITPAGVLTTLHSFDSADGAYPVASLMQDTNGNFYGTTLHGAIGYGTVFSLSVGLSPFVKTQPASGYAGMAVKILGTNLTGATKVTFNGHIAVFKVISNSLITATVPVGATTGTVEVATPEGTLLSNVPFQVVPCPSCFSPESLGGD